MEKTYTNEENIIMLAVVASDRLHDLEMVMRWCKRYDKRMTRTLAVVTKPDLATFECTDNGITVYGPELQATDDTIVGGWQYMHVLRNHDYNQDSPNCVDGSYPASLELRFGGVDSLREKMSKLLRGCVQTQLPKLISQIERNLKGKDARLLELDTPSAVLKVKRAHLLEKAGEFQRLTRDAVSDTDRKLRATIRNYNHAFMIVLSTKGENLKISREDGDKGGGQTTSGREIGCGVQDAPPHLAPFTARYKFSNPKPISKSNLVDLFPPGSRKNTPSSAALSMTLAVNLFQKQIRPWEAIAKRHVTLVADVAREFIDQLAGHIFGQNGSAYGVLLDSYVGPFFDKTRDLLNDKVEELLWPYAKGYALPFDERTMMRWTETFSPNGGTDGPSSAESSDQGTREAQR